MLLTTQGSIPEDTGDTPPLDGYLTADGVHVVVWCKYSHRLRWHGHCGKDAPLCGSDHELASLSGSDTLRGVNVLLGLLIWIGLVISVIAAVVGYRGGMKEDPDNPGFYLLPRHGKSLLWLTIAGSLLAAASGYVALFFVPKA